MASAFAIFSGGSLLLILARVLWINGAQPEAKTLGLIGSVIIGLTVLAAFWINSPTGLHSNADVRPNGLADTRPDWMKSQ